MSDRDVNGINILSLPNEILLFVIKKLNMVDVFSSLVNVNQRFNQLILDPPYVNHIDLTAKLFDKENFPVYQQVLSKIGKEILPQINNYIRRLAIDQYSLGLLLDTIIYPNLYSLSLVDLQPDVLISCLKGDTKLRRLFAAQITQIDIRIIDKTTTLFSEDKTNLFELVLSIGKCLTDFTFTQWFCHKSYEIPTFHPLLNDCFSSTLTKLTIAVTTFDDCLYLLNGRLDSLTILIIDILRITEQASIIDNTRQLPKLKYFSLFSFAQTKMYDSQVVPLLCRMSNLEKLRLYLSIERTDLGYVDGNHLYDHILVYMPQLKQFIFNINTLFTNTYLKVNLPLNKDIQYSFIRLGYQQIASYVHHESIEISSCHVYSLPYDFNIFHNMNCSFQGGMFNNVQRLMMSDEKHPFAQSLFQIISNSFPFLERLILYNDHAQRRKQHSFPTITFQHLCSLDLRNANVNYGALFLDDTKIHLPSLLQLKITYKSLAIITHNFTNDATRITCAHLKTLHIHGPHIRPEHFHAYFPSWRKEGNSSSNFSP